MKKTTAQSLANRLLEPLGITINGPHPWDIQIHNDHFYSRVARAGALGLGEAYMDKWWNCKQLDVFFERISRAKLDATEHKPFHFWFMQWLGKIMNFQTKKRAKKIADHHYDLGNTLFQAMLDQRMIYSCGYWKTAQTLDEAQTAKLELICQKLQLKPGLRVLDIGCGWGGLAKYAAENYGVHVTGVTISKQQYDYAKTYCHGLPVDIRLQDYRDCEGTFDRIVSVGMFEHVGHLNYNTFMTIAHRALADDGLFLLHTIGVNKTSPFLNTWIAKYIFPVGILPSIVQIAKASENLFVMEDWHNFGADYDKTLMAWYDNFLNHWKDLKMIYDERFYRMWTYYLLSCAGGFRARTIQLWQVVFSKKGVLGGYSRLR